jgi:antitoxin VapB
MGLNIKNPEVVALIRELARARNVDMTEAIRGAVERDLALERDRAESRLRKMRAISDRIAAMPDLDTRSVDELLYDENGLPK